MPNAARWVRHIRHHSLFGGPGGVGRTGPHLIGQDPLNIGQINRTMGAALRGHPYAKAPVDIACWDLLGKATDQPLYTLLGSAAQGDVVLFRTIGQDAPDLMARKIEGHAAEGYTKFQLKVGGAANEDIDRIHATSAVLKKTDLLVADANTGWTRHQAARVGGRFPIWMSM